MTIGTEATTANSTANAYSTHSVTRHLRSSTTAISALQVGKVKGKLHSTIIRKQHRTKGNKNTRILHLLLSLCSLPRSSSSYVTDIFTRSYCNYVSNNCLSVFDSSTSNESKSTGRDGKSFCPNLPTNTHFPNIWTWFVLLLGCHSFCFANRRRGAKTSAQLFWLFCFLVFVFSHKESKCVCSNTVWCLFCWKHSSPFHYSSSRTTNGRGVRDCLSLILTLLRPRSRQSDSKAAACCFGLIASNISNSRASKSFLSARPKLVRVCVLPLRCAQVSTPPLTSWMRKDYRCAHVYTFKCLFSVVLIFPEYFLRIFLCKV